MKKLLLTALSAVAAALVAASAFAQVTTANISGKISDKEGAVVGVPVLAVFTQSGASYYAVTDNKGIYHINGIQPGGPYTITVEALGYKTVSESGIYAALAETTIWDAVLQDDSMKLDESVLIADASEAGMNIRRSGIGTAISNRSIQNMPVSTKRSLNDLLKLTPQATTGGSGLAVGGGNYRSSYITVDGAAFNNAFGIGANLPANGTPISLDALEQMSVNITPFDVRQSGFTGAAVNAVTKSGTNELKVSVYDYYTSDKVMGRKYFNNTKGEVQELAVADKLSNTIGASVGGPIIKNKLFFFVNFEYDPQTAPATTALANDGSWTVEGSSSYRRPTAAKMEEIKGFLKEKFNYDPGRYENYSVDIPVIKFLARVDWNINDVHKFNIRYSQANTKAINPASSSISPLNDVGYARYTQGRTTSYALPFESANYFQEQNFYSVAAELNSRFMEGRLNNTLRATYSLQNDPRSFYGDNFPTVDILEDGAVYTTFGPDPFTYGNLRYVNTMVFTDEVNWSKGMHNFIAGAQYEHNNTKNGFMQGGMGWYTYASWDDFKNDRQPLAFMITHSNRDDLKQVYPQFDYNQASAYFQDEMDISDRFKFTAGLRLEMPFYPTLDDNENKAFAAMYNEFGHNYRTSDMPQAHLNISPRVGFNWDVKGDRSIIVRGGSGVYTGRIPFVWIVSVAGNSNCLQAQNIMGKALIDASTDGKVKGYNIPSFHNTVSGITDDLYGGSFKAGDLAAPSSATILDKDLKMPTVWKSSLAADFSFANGWKASLEGIYNKDVNSVVVNKIGVTEGKKHFEGEPLDRIYTSNTAGKNQAYLITNKGIAKQGYYASLTASIKKSFAWGLDLMAAYTYSDAKSVTDGDGDQITSGFTETVHCVNGSNANELGYSSFVSPNRVIANANYRIEYAGKHLATNISLFYEGYNYGYNNKYAASRFSYCMLNAAGKNVTGEGGASNLIYIPTSAELSSMEFTSAENRKAYDEFIASDNYLSKHRGEYSVRSGAVMPWYSQIGLKVSEDFMFNVAGKTHTLRVGADINNLGNLINAKWGNVKRIESSDILTYDNGVYTFNQSQSSFNNYADYISTWSVMLSARYFF